MHITLDFIMPQLSISTKSEVISVIPKAIYFSMASIQTKQEVQSKILNKINSILLFASYDDDDDSVIHSNS